MKQRFLCGGVISGLALCWAALSGCSDTVEDQSSSVISLTPAQHAIAGLEGYALRTQQHDSGDLVFASSEQRGLAIFSDQGLLLASGVGDSKSVDVRVDREGEGVWTLNLDESANQLVFGRYDLSDKKYRIWEWPQQWDYALTVGCLSISPAIDSVNVWAVSEEGQAFQLALLLNDGVVQAREVRQIALGEGVLSCSVDDQNQRFYWSQEGVGVLSLNSDEEMDESRRLLAGVSPVGHLTAAPTDVQYLDGKGLLLTEMDSGQVQLLSSQGQVLQKLSFHGELPAGVTSFSGLPNKNSDGWRWWGMPEEGEGLWSGESAMVLVDAQSQRSSAAATETFIVQPLLETDSVDSFGDAADDPEIWVNRQQPQLSLVLGTDKKQGLAVYDLQGKLVQMLARGNLNNVDIRYAPGPLGEGLDVAMATNRSTHNIDLFAIDPSNRQVRFIAGELMDGSLGEPYGGCLYQSSQSEALYAFVNNKDGLFQQWEILQGPESSHKQPQIAARLVREFSLPGQPEGCVADDENALLYMGEEDFGIWFIGAEPDSGSELTLLDSVEQGYLVADVEGLSLYHDASGHGYVVVSSQGDNSYVLYDRQTHAYAGRFRVMANLSAGVDGSSETDGLAVTSANLGGDFGRGLLVVQDGRNRMPATRQNFKLVPWSEVEAKLHLQPHIADK